MQKRVYNVYGNDGKRYEFSTGMVSDNTIIKVVEYGGLARKIFFGAVIVIALNVIFDYLVYGKITLVSGTETGASSLQLSTRNTIMASIVAAMFGLSQILENSVTSVLYKNVPQDVKEKYDNRNKWW
jgi:hypothetical protein